jgi:ribosomal protein S6--L-glutamate ligase
MRIGVAGISGAWSSEQLAASIRKEGADSFVFSLGHTTHDLATGLVQWQAQDLRHLDGVVVKKLGDQSSAWGRLRLHALRALEVAGVRVFSPADVIDVAMDRYRMMMRLAEAGLPIPETIAAESQEGLAAAIRRLGDCVVKPVYTSKGRGMIRVDGANQKAIDAASLAGGDQRYLVQKFVQAPGRDIGATVIGGTSVGAFFREARDGE